MSILFIYGAGGLGKELADTCYKLGSFSSIAFVTDDGREQEVMGIKVYSFEEAVSMGVAADTQFIVALGEPRHRKRIYEKLKENDLSIGKIIGATAEVSPFAQIENGTVICPLSIVTDAKIGFGCYINYGACIPDNVVIGNYCNIGPRVNVSGNVRIGDECYIGVGAALRENITIGHNAIIGMGSVVLKDVPNDFIVAGNPAKFLRKNETGRVF